MNDDAYRERARPLLSPGQVHSRDEVLARDSAIPARPGVYAWYFDELPPGVPRSGLHCRRVRHAALRRNRTEAPAVERPGLRAGSTSANASGTTSEATRTAPRSA